MIHIMCQFLAMDFEKSEQIFLIWKATELHFLPRNCRRKQVISTVNLKPDILTLNLMGNDDKLSAKFLIMKKCALADKIFVLSNILI